MGEKNLLGATTRDVCVPHDGTCQPHKTMSRYGILIETNMFSQFEVLFSFGHLIPVVYSSSVILKNSSARERIAPSFALKTLSLTRGIIIELSQQTGHAADPRQKMRGESLKAPKTAHRKTRKFLAWSEKVDGPERRQGYFTKSGEDVRRSFSVCASRCSLSHVHVTSTRFEIRTNQIIDRRWNTYRYLIEGLGPYKLRPNPWPSHSLLHIFLSISSQENR